MILRVNASMLETVGMPEPLDELEGCCLLMTRSKTLKLILLL